jgi:hypothetical protein
VARIEIVVAHGDVKQLIRHLGGHGFRAADEMAGSAVSLVADDGWAMLDLHLGLFGVAPDRVTRAARGIAVDGAIDGASLPVACLEHALLFAASAAAEAGFGRLSVREVVDAGMLLRLGAAIDWPTVHAIARASRLDGALRTLLALLVDLGLAANAVPAALGRPPHWPARRKFDRLADGFRELFAASLPPVRA